MYYNRISKSAGSSRYGQIDLAGRIEGASPHGLISILYEELLIAIQLAASGGQHQVQAQALSRGLNILQSLQDSLDFERGGEVSATLARVYDEVRRQLLTGVREQQPDRVRNAREIIAGIADAWRQIG